MLDAAKRAEMDQGIAAMSVPRTCVLCRAIKMSATENDWSEVTPGAEWRFWCSKGHWDMDGYDASLEKYRDNMLMAETCPDFEAAELSTKDVWDRDAGKENTEHAMPPPPESTESLGL